MRNIILLSVLLCICQFAMAGEKQWTGTGFALKDKYVITNYHVVDGARTLKVRGINGDLTKMYNAVVVAKDATHDMAIIRIEDDKFNGFGDIPYSIKSGLSEVGEDIFVLGYPLMSTMGEEVKLTTGIISSRSGFQGDVSAYQISAPIQPGNSGGPLFDSNGDIVGIVNAKHGQADNASYAIKSPYMYLFIQNNISINIIPSSTSLTNMSLIDKVKKIKPFVYIIYGNTTNDQLTVSHSSTSPQTQCYKIGDIVDKDGVMGIVFEIDESCKHGKLISIKQTKCNWNEAKNWCNKLGSGWRLPNKDELRKIHMQKALINNILSQKEQGILGKYFWSIEEFGWLAQFVSIHSGRTDYSDKSLAYYVRAVYIF